MRILFTGREHRVRRRETILHPPKGIKFIPLQPLSEMKKDHELTNTTSHLKDKIKRYVNFINENNKIPKNKLKNINLIYSPGHLVFNNFPFVVEIDNVAALTYYNIRLLKLFKQVIKKRLKSRYCKSIICISEAAKKSVVNYFNDKEIEKKCIIVYPYSNYPKIKKKKSIKTRFLFISSSFYLKGGKETANAFISANSKNATLTIITKINDIDDDLLKKIKKNKNIYLVEANMNKKELFSKYYSNTDVFILPTYQDSFGLVYLEALSAKLPIIATKTFAVPEMIEDKKNGFLCIPPLNIFKENCTPNKHWWYKDKIKYAKTHELKYVEEFLEEKIKLLTNNPKIINKMSQYSNKIYKEKFNEIKRKKDLLYALNRK
ncbi:MAG: glycosyltransferase [Candidatus Woesearchaeota archaeon]|jgi:glycosyltransferase involved in cell wall biosynthesis